MTKETLYEMIGEINEEYIFQAKQTPQKKPHRWVKWCSLAACLCLILGISLHIAPWNISNGSGFGENVDTTLLEVHRDDFTPEIDDSILAQLTNPSEVKKAYWLLTNEWFLSDELTDFSQVVTTDACYISWCDEDGLPSETSYSVYSLDENGRLAWGYTAEPPADAFIPYGFWKLSYEIIDTALSEINYEDYVITYSPRLGTVFVWVRGTTEDLILTYPTRPDLLGITCGGIYTLEELQEKLVDAYEQ